MVGLATACQTIAPGFDDQILAIGRAWDEARHGISDEPSQMVALRALESQIDALVENHPDDYRLRVWRGIVLAGQADVSNWGEALRLADRARRSLLSVNPARLDPTTATELEIALGALYDQAPGFPVSFGDAVEAERHFRRAIAIDPAGLESNYYFADFLVRRRRYADAKAMLQRALQAALRPGRESGDKSVHEDAAALQALLGRRPRR